MSCALFYKHLPFVVSVRNAPGLFCQGCARSVPITPAPPYPPWYFPQGVRNRVKTGELSFC